MTARDAAIREETSPFPALAGSVGDYSFVMYILPFAPKELMQTVQVVAGCRKDAWREGGSWEPIPITDFEKEPILSLINKLKQVQSDARAPSTDEEHHSVLALNDML
jgi:hypothetical protein